MTTVDEQPQVLSTRAPLRSAIWRPLERTQDAIATDGLAFLRGLLARQAQGSNQP